MDAYERGALASAPASGTQIAPNQRDGFFIGAATFNSENLEIAEPRGEFGSGHDARCVGLFSLGHWKLLIIAGEEMESLAPARARRSHVGVLGMICDRKMPAGTPALLETRPSRFTSLGALADNPTGLHEYTCCWERSSFLAHPEDGVGGFYGGAIGALRDLPENSF